MQFGVVRVAVPSGSSLGPAPKGQGQERSLRRQLRFERSCRIPLYLNPGQVGVAHTIGRATSPNWKNAIERAIVLGSAEMLLSKDLPKTRWKGICRLKQNPVGPRCRTRREVIRKAFEGSAANRPSPASHRSGRSLELGQTSLGTAF